MDFGFTKEQEEFRQEVVKLCERWQKGEIKDPDMTEFLGQPYSPVFYREAAKKGFIGAQFPREYGGAGLGLEWLVIFQEEAQRQKAPISLSFAGTTINFMGGFIADCGSEELKKRFLPPLIRGDLTIAQNLSESESSSDLSCPKTTARKEGDYYIVNGDKCYSSFAHMCDHGLTSVKTDPKAPPGEGVSLLLIDMKSPGITLVPMKTITGSRCSQVYFDDVKVPAENLIGEEGRGWEYLHKYMYRSWDRRLGLFVASFGNALKTLIKYAKETNRNGKPLSKDPLVRQKLAQLAIDIEAMRLLNYRVAWAEDQEGENLDVIGYGAISSVFLNQLTVKFANTALQILGMGGQLEPGSKHAPLAGAMEKMYLTNLMRLFSSGGVLTGKNFIASHILDLPGATYP